MFGRTTLSNRVARLESEVAGIRRLYEKTISYGDSDPETALMNARKAAEAVCSRVFEHKVGKPPKSLTLQPLIEKLAQLDALPEHILIALRTIQNYGNFGSHHQAGEPQPITSEFAQPCLQSLGTVVRWYCQDFEQADSAAPDGSATVPPSSITPSGWKGVPIWLLAGGTLCMALAIPFLYSFSGQLGPPTVDVAESHNVHTRRTAESAHTQDSIRYLPDAIAWIAEPTSSASALQRTAPALRQQRLAVLPFKPLSAGAGNVPGYEEGIVRILEKALASSRDFDLVERADIDKVISELQLTRDRQFDQSTVARIGRLVGATQLLLGSYFTIGKTLRIDARIVDAETGRILSSTAREGDPENISALVTAIGEEIVESHNSPTE